MKWLKRFSYTLLAFFIFLNIVTAFHAYKFTHFYNITAAVKKPEQMTGLEKTEAIVFGVDYPKKKNKFVPPIPYNNFSIKTDDGLTLRGWFICNKHSDSESKGAVILFHGHAGNKGDVLKEALAFEQMNYCVYLVDLERMAKATGILALLVLMKVKM